MKSFPSDNRGFTLIETFVAVVILVFAVIGPLGLLARAINDGNYAKNQVTAYYLAQEGLELVINQRDENLSLISEGLLEADNWQSGLAPCTGGCKISPDREVASCRLSANSCRLYIRDGIYTHKSSATPSLFSREVKIEEIALDRTEVTSTVVWRNKDQDVSFSLSTIVLNQAAEPPSTI